MNSSVILVLSLVLLVWVNHTYCLPFGGNCDSCGRECQSACGTKGFRTCCFNYLKKRSTPLSTNLDLKQELMMVLPELAQYYPSLRSLIPDPTDRDQLSILFEKPETEFRKGLDVTFPGHV